MAWTAWKTRPPLYCEVENYLQKSLESHASVHGGIIGFDMCNKLMMSRESGDDFRSRLSMSQLHSWKILYDWWVNDIEVRARHYGDVLSVACLRLSIIDAVLGSREPCCMAGLWQKEFVRKDVCVTMSDKLNMLVLQQSRWDGSFTYARQRLAKSEIQEASSQPFVGPHPLTNVPTVLGATPDPCPWLDLKRNGLHTPHYLWDMKRHRTIVASKLGQNLTYLAISHTWGRWEIGGKTRRITGVPWAVPQNSRFEVKNLPYLLTRLPFSVAYVWIDLLCIPQDNSRPEFEAIKRQEISRQASIFSGAACAMAWLNDIADWRGLRQALEWLSIRYFKLFNSGPPMTDHIHNMGVTEEVLENLLDSTTSRVDMSIGLCDGTTSLPQGLTTVNNMSSWFSSLWTLQEAFLRPDMLLCNSKFDVLTASEGFYVTLDMIKALINAFDCPGGGNLEGSAVYPLRNAVRSNTQLSSFFSSLWPSAPQTVLALRDFCNYTRLWNGLLSSPEMILSLASCRSSTETRAEAIMSVLGATDWYQSEGAAGAPTTHDLVFGMYPFAFVLEVRNKLGGVFFLSGHLNLMGRGLKWPHTGELADRKSLLNAKRSIPHGTMLPFSPIIISPHDSHGNLLDNDGWWQAGSDKEVAEIDKSHYYIIVSSAAMLGYSPGWDEHPAVKTWRLRLNGNVLIDSAAIEISSFGQSDTRDSVHHEEKVNSTRSGGKASGKVKSDPHWPEAEYIFRTLDIATGVPIANMRRAQETSLERVMFPGVKHAVCVGEFSDNKYIHRAGVILGGQYAKDSKYYVRIGYYDCKIPLRAKEARQLPSQKVDWVVL